MNRSDISRHLKPALFFLGIILLGASALIAPYSSAAQTFPDPFLYTFNNVGVLYEAQSAASSTSPYFWLVSGGKLIMDGTVGETIQYDLSRSDPLYILYATRAAIQSDGGAHPQNSFFLLSKMTALNASVSIYFNRARDNLSDLLNQHPYNAESVIARYVDGDNYYIGSIRADGQVVIKKKVGGVYTTLAAKKIFPGTFSLTTPNIIPHDRWIGLKLDVIDTDIGPQLTLYTDYGWTGTWKLWLTVLDDPAKFGEAVDAAGYVGVESDYADMAFDNFLVRSFDPAIITTSTIAATTDTASVGAANYDDTVLAGDPVLYLAMNTPASRIEHDLTGSGHSGTYQGGTPTTVTMPDGSQAARFDGSGEYLSVPSAPELSITKTGELTWEGWVRADTLTFQNATASGYVDWMGKCQDYSPSCEWEARIYSTDTTEDRPSRFSAYVFNPSAGLGSGADWQPSTSTISANEWIYVVAEYQTLTTPSICPAGTPGTIAIWIDGVQQSFIDHAPTGCMSQYQVSPQTGNSPLNIGTMALDSWFPGAVGKVAVYDRLLSQTEIDSHFKAMTGVSPEGSCGITCSLTSDITSLLSQVF